MQKRRPTAITSSESSSAFIQFPIPNVGSGNDADPRWQRVEALYRELDTLDAGDHRRLSFDQQFRMRLEQMFCHYILPILLESLDAEGRARWMTITHQAENYHAGVRRREALARIAAGRSDSISDNWAADRPDESGELEDLLIILQRKVDDRRRQRARAGAR